MRSRKKSHMMYTLDGGSDGCRYSKSEEIGWKKESNWKLIILLIVCITVSMWSGHA